MLAWTTIRRPYERLDEQLQLGRAATQWKATYLSTATSATITLVEATVSFLERQVSHKSRSSYLFVGHDHWRTLVHVRFRTGLPVKALR